MADVIRLYENTFNLDHKFGMQDPNWRQCVYDHRQQIIEHSVEVSFTLEHAHQWRYRLQEFIKAKYNLPYEVVWIVFWLNNFQNLDYDGGVLKVLIPRENYLNELYHAMGGTVIYT